MFVDSLKAVAMIALPLAVASAGTAALAQGNERATNAPASAKNDEAARGPRKQAGPNQLLIHLRGHLTLIAPDGTGEKEVFEQTHEFNPSSHRFAPDGKRVAVALAGSPVTFETVNEIPRQRLYVRGLDEAEPGTDLGVTATYLSWSPDNQSLVVSDLVRPGDGTKAAEFLTWRVDIKTKKKTEVTIPSNQYVTDWSSDGRYFLTTELKKGRANLHVVSSDLREDRVVTKEGVPSGVDGRFSPDAGQVLYRAGDNLVVLNLRSGEATPVINVPKGSPRELYGYCWSPDGKRIAHAWKIGRAPDEPAESRLIVSDVDGGNAITILARTGQFARQLMGDVDWR
jgi:Tol biopolymer transport system component